MKENVFYNLYEPYTAEDENAVFDLADSIAENEFKWADHCMEDDGRKYLEICFGVNVADAEKFIEKGFDY